MSRVCGLVALWIAVLLAECLSAQVFEGRVLEDHSGNPLASVRVRVHRVGTVGLAADLETVADGRFRAVGLPEGDYRIEVSKGSYATTTLGLRLPASPLLVRLVRFGSITGQVTDPEGRPARGAAVFPVVQSANGSFRKLVDLGGAQIDDLGQYRLYDLPPGRYAVAVSWASMNTGSTSGAYLYPNNTRPRLFTVSGGEEYRGVDFTAPLNAAYRVSGSVQLPAPGVTAAVTLVSLDQPGLAVAMTRADTAGAFHLEGIPMGSYDLFAVAPAVGFGGRSVLLGPEPLFGRTHVEVAGQDVDGVAVSLGRGRTVRFVLRAANPQSAAACSSGATLALSSNEDWGAMLDRRVELSFAKVQVVDGLAPGRYHLELEKLGEGCFGAAAPIVDVTAAADSDPIPVLVAAAASIRGRLSAGAARPGDFAVVLLRSDAFEGERAIQVAIPDAKSEFAFSGLHPGRYWIAAKPAMEAAGKRWIQDVENMLEIEVLSGGPTELTLPVPATGEGP